MSFIVETCLSETYPIIDSNPGITNYKLFAGWSTIDLSKRREAIKVREEDSHKPRMRDGQKGLPRGRAIEMEDGQ